MGWLNMRTARRNPPLAILFILVAVAAAMLACGPVEQPNPEVWEVLPAAEQDRTAIPDTPPPAQEEGDDNADSVDEIPSTPPPKPTETYPKIRGSQLHSDVVEFEEAQDAASGPSGQSDSAPEDTVVLVSIFLSSNKAEVAAWLRSKGITPGHADDPDISGLDAYVPLSLLGELSQQDGVIEIEQPILPEATN